MRTRWWRRAGPWATPLVAVVEVVLVTSKLLAVHTAVLAGLLVEAAFWLTAISRTRAALARYRSERRERANGWRAAEDGIAELVPRPLARVLLLEPHLLACLARWAAGHHEGRSPASFTYHRGIRFVVLSIVAVVVVEGAVVEALLAALLPGTGKAWVWVALGVHLYALVWLAGFHASLVTHPHRVGAGALLVRDGIFSELEIPYVAVLGARRTARPNLGRSGLKLDPETASATLAVGDANVAIDLDPASPAHRPSDDDVCLRVLYLTVDEPERFIDELRARAVRSSRALRTSTPT